MDEIPELDIELPEITQVGFVVEDIEDAVERYRAIFGLDTWEAYRFEPPEYMNSEFWYFDTADVLILSAVPM